MWGFAISGVDVGLISRKLDDLAYLLKREVDSVTMKLIDKLADRRNVLNIRLKRVVNRESHDGVPFFK
jgi:hypothetical protein